MLEILKFAAESGWRFFVVLVLLLMVLWGLEAVASIIANAIRSRR